MSDPLVANCIIEGSPPAGFSSWSDYFIAVFEHRVLTNIKIAALQEQNDE